ncbi:uncharacterized protein LOC100122669 isoform X1 [Nasonia vitripennis]|uniref:Alpha-carbonic anhydrase domain-containing protein n=1 Tax=Nasonia vitripennis TaxID=7425 RepID=A0A7M7QVR0_NASVI|nr:uncharacterized protein LOC100122669 isoform X1 [Nasonia vitripennis]
MLISPSGGGERGNRIHIDQAAEMKILDLPPRGPRGKSSSLLPITLIFDPSSSSSSSSTRTLRAARRKQENDDDYGGGERQDRSESAHQARNGALAAEQELSVTIAASSIPPALEPSPLTPSVLARVCTHTHTHTQVVSSRQGAYIRTSERTQTEGQVVRVDGRPAARTYPRGRATRFPIPSRGCGSGSSEQPQERSCSLPGWQPTGPFSWASGASSFSSSSKIQIFGFNSHLYNNFSDALHRAQGIVAVSLLLQVGDLSNPEVRLFTEHLDKITYGGQSMEIKRFGVRELLPDTMHYMTYDGSTTMPACHETTTWIILNKPIYITKQQLRSLRELRQGDMRHPKAPLGNNFRPPQPLHHRPVRTNIDFNSEHGPKNCPTMNRDIYYKANSWK